MVNCCQFIHSGRKSLGFTVVVLLVVIATTGIFGCFTVPANQAARESA